MEAGLKMMGQGQGKFSLLLFYLGSISMCVVIAVASCTSRETFAAIYQLIAEFLLISKTSVSMTLRESPGLGHFLCYALLCFSLSGIFSRRSVFIAPQLALGFGVLMEFVQVFIPSRDASFLDILVNGLGIFVGLALFLLVQRFWCSAGGGTYPLSRR